MVLLPLANPALSKDGQSRDILASLLDTNRITNQAVNQPSSDQAKACLHAPVKRTRGSSSSVQLNKEIMATRSVEELLALVKSKAVRHVATWLAAVHRNMHHIMPFKLDCRLSCLLCQVF